jgi:hypothetical protein
MKRRYFRKPKVVTFAGKVLDVKKDEHSVTLVRQGVKQNQIGQYENLGYTVSGGNAWLGFPQIERHLYLYAEISTYGKQEMDIRELALIVNNRERLTDSFVGKLRDRLRGKVMKFHRTDGRFEPYNPEDLVL